MDYGMRGNVGFEIGKIGKRKEREKNEIGPKVGQIGLEYNQMHQNIKQ